MDQSVKSEFQKSLTKTKVFLKWVGLGLILLYLFSGIYSISSNEIGVLQRFGKVLEKDVRPGIHFGLPWPIDRINRVPVKKVETILIDDFYEKGDNAALFLTYTGLTRHCVTGDNNIVTINCVLQYTIGKPNDYIFNINRVKLALRCLATNTLLHRLSEMPVDEILTYGKKEIENSVKLELQTKLDKIQSGINITFVELKDVRPPLIVQNAFDDVINAKIDKRKMISRAESYQNEKIPGANGQAARLVHGAEAYKKGVIARAKGETGRFLKQLAEYRKNPEVTRQRLRRELINKTLPLVEKKIIVDKDSINLKFIQP